MFLVAESDVGKRIRDSREAYKGVGMKQVDLAKRLGVSQARLSNWERGEHQPPNAVVKRIAQILEVEAYYLLGIPAFPQRLAKEQTRVYNSGDDSDPDPSLVEAAKVISDTHTITGMAITGGSGRVWIAKGVPEPVVIYAFIGLTRPIVKLAVDALNNQFAPGTMLVFELDDYAHPDTFLLVQNRDYPDEHSIRIVDPKDSHQFLAVEPGQDPLPASQWKVIGYAWALVRGTRNGKPNVDLRPGGIGPTTL